MRARSTREKTTEQEKNRKTAEEARLVAGLIDGTIWKRRGAGSLMSLRIDEDKMGPGSRGNNLWGLHAAPYGPCPGSARL